MTLEEARLRVIEGINYAAYKETESSLHDSDKNRLFGSEHYKSDRAVAQPSPWTEGDFEENMALLLHWAHALNRSDPAFAEAQELLQDEDSVIGRIVRLSKENNSQWDEPREKELPRWLQLLGLILGLITVPLAFAALSLLIVPNKRAPLLTIIVGGFMVVGCVWVLEKCFRLMTGRKIRGGLMSPTTLRVVSVCMLVLPVAGLFTGYYQKMGAVAIFQAVMYFFGFLGLRAMARRREATESRVIETPRK